MRDPLPMLGPPPHASAPASASASTADSDRARARAGWLSLAVGAAILLGKFGTWGITGSAAVLSDAMESVVNVVAAVLLVFSLRVAARPADRDHPYGHGKVEFFSAGIEGALIVGAALLIVFHSVRELIAGPELRRLDLGVALLAGLSGVNALLGWHLVRTGRQTGSMALVADGRHVLTDVWTSAAVIAGLAAVWATDIVWLDPVIALLAAANILASGWRLLRDATRRLMDAADEGALLQILETLGAVREDAWIDVHGLRSWRAGAFEHVDLHMTVPRYLDVATLHDIHDRVERALFPGIDSGARPPDEASGQAAGSGSGDVVVHFDPCTPDDCRRCAMPECHIRREPCAGRAVFSLDGAVGPPES